MSLERGPLSLMRIIEELLERTVAAPVYKTEINYCGGFVALTTRHPVPAKVGTNSLTSCGRSVGIVRACVLKPRSLFCLAFNLFLRMFLSLLRQHIVNSVPNT
jgi:hypothetical protein